MDSSGLAFLLFFGVIAFFIYLYVKWSNENDSEDKHTSTDSASAPATKSSVSIPPTPKPPESAPAKKEGQKYISIYEYTPTQSARKCAYCDGENTYSAKVCCICGNDIDS